MDQQKSSDDVAAGEYVRKLSPPPFLVKTYMLVGDEATDDVISWNEEGTGFVVWQAAEFARDLLPTLFKHCNFSSFVRQLNTYGFRKVATSRWEFCNDMFRKGERGLLCQIRRRKAWANKNNTKPSQQHQNDFVLPQQQQFEGEEDNQLKSSSSTSSASNNHDHHQQFTTLVGENERLKKENGVLSSELTSMKRKCKDLLELVVKYANKEEEEDRRPMPKLFGVRLDSAEREKRRRIAEMISDHSANNVFFLSQSCK
jgi:heat shock transcription factor